MRHIPTNIDWTRLACAFTAAGVKGTGLESFGVSDTLLYYLRKAESDPNPTWSTVLCLWSAAEARLTEKEIEGCCIDPTKHKKDRA